MTAAARHSLADYLRPKTLVMLALGFSSGLPFLLVGNTFGYWLRDEGTALSAIGFLSWVGIAYSLKFLWAPVLDRVDVPGFARLGHRRGWMLLAQLFVCASLIAMGAMGLEHGLAMLGALALVAAFSSSTQDTAIDAWRIEIADNGEELGLLTSAYQLGYRTAMLATDALILVIAEHLSWSIAYMLYGAAMIVGIAATLFAREPVRADAIVEAATAPLWTPRGFADAVIGPFVAFFEKFGGFAIVMLLAISLFQLPNFVMGPMANPLYHDIGLSKDVVAAVRGSAGLIAVFLGIAAGGFVCARLDPRVALIMGGSMQIVGTALYAVLPYAHGLWTFAAVMALDNFGIAMAGVTLVSYMSSLTSLGYTATQYALLTSTYAWAGKILKGFSGWVVDALSVHTGHMQAYAIFFIGAGLIGIPALVLFGILSVRQQALRPAP
jgi:PAT family beta-lactamase induction signal transducer AmpG